MCAQPVSRRAVLAAAGAAVGAGAVGAYAVRRGDPGFDPSDTYRFLSVPDFLNADVADLDVYRPDRPDRVVNSISPTWKDSLTEVMSDWRSWKPDDVLVAGDLVEGRWGQDDDNTGTFGPVGTWTKKDAALDLAAATYYQAWWDRWKHNGLPRPHTAVGDHEIGDDPWDDRSGHTKWKRARLRRWRERYAQYATDGGDRYANHPKGPSATTAYAWRPRPWVQIVTLDVWSLTSDKTDVHAELDPRQLAWLRRVLGSARNDGVPWLIVQGHTPILSPVRSKMSSALTYSRGADSELWATLVEYGVGMYLCGEVHDITATTTDGVLQLAHGGLMGFDGLNYLIADMTPVAANLIIYNYADAWHKLGDQERLWEPQKDGRPPAHVRYTAASRQSIGGIKLTPDAEFSKRWGVLEPYDGP